jgi:hypothetical protein
MPALDLWERKKVTAAAPTLEARCADFTFAQKGMNFVLQSSYSN